MSGWESAIVGGIITYLLTGMYLCGIFFKVTRSHMWGQISRGDKCVECVAAGILTVFWVCLWPLAIYWLLTDEKG